MEPDGGRLKLLDQFVVPNGSPPSLISMPMAHSPDRRFLYIALRSKPYSVASFRIDPSSGKLTYLGASPLVGNYCYIATDRTGGFLFAASYQHMRYSVSPIDPSGVVQAPRSVVIADGNMHCVLPDPSNRYVFVANLSSDVIVQLRFDAASGVLKDNEPSSASAPAKSGPRHFAFHPNGRFLYLLNETAASICVFRFDAASGGLTRLDTVSALPGEIGEQPFAADIHLTPDGRFLYASVRKSSTLAAFAVDAGSGRLSLIGHYPTEKKPRAFAIDPSGRFLFAAGQLSDGITQYRIDAATGELAPLERYQMGKNPGWIEFVSLP